MRKDHKREKEHILVCMVQREPWLSCFLGVPHEGIHQGQLELRFEGLAPAPRH